MALALWTAPSVAGESVSPNAGDGRRRGGSHLDLRRDRGAARLGSALQDVVIAVVAKHDDRAVVVERQAVGIVHGCLPDVGCSLDLMHAKAGPLRVLCELGNAPQHRRAHRRRLLVQPLSEVSLRAEASRQLQSSSELSSQWIKSSVLSNSTPPPSASSRSVSCSPACHSADQ